MTDTQPPLRDNPRTKNDVWMKVGGGALVLLAIFSPGAFFMLLIRVGILAGGLYLARAVVRFLRSR